MEISAAEFRACWTACHKFFCANPTPATRAAILDTFTNNPAKELWLLEDPTLKGHAIYR